jgi:hypothetical protein
MNIKIRQRNMMNLRLSRLIFCAHRILPTVHPGNRHGWARRAICWYNRNLSASGLAWKVSDLECLWYDLWHPDPTPWHRTVWPKTFTKPPWRCRTCGMGIPRLIQNTSVRTGAQGAPILFQNIAARVIGDIVSSTLVVPKTGQYDEKRSESEQV